MKFENKDLKSFSPYLKTDDSPNKKKKNSIKDKIFQLNQKKFSNENDVLEKKLKFFDYFLFGFVCFVYMCYGFSSTLVGSTIPFIKENLKVSNKEILSSFTLRYLSFIFFNFIFIFTIKRLNRQYQLSLGSFIYSIVFFTLPLIENYTQLLILFILQGSGSVIFDSIPVLISIEIFQDKSKFFSQILFLFFSFGGFLGPLAASKFIEYNSTITNEIVPSLNNDTNEHKLDFDPSAQYIVIYNIFNSFFSQLNKTDNNHIITKEEKKSQFHIPFFFISFMFLSCCVILIIIQLYCSNHGSKKKEKKDFHEKSIESSSVYTIEKNLKISLELPKYYKITILVLSCIILSCFTSIDQIINLFLSSYLEKRTDLKLSKKTQSSAYSYLALTNTIGKFLSLYLVWYIPQKLYLSINWVLILIGVTLLNFVTLQHLFILKVSLLFIGLGLSCTYPLIFTLVNKRITVKSKTQTIFLFSIVSQMLYIPILMGFYIETFYQIFNVFLDVYTIISISAITLFVILEKKLFQRKFVINK